MTEQHIIIEGDNQQEIVEPSHVMEDYVAVPGSVVTSSTVIAPLDHPLNQSQGENTEFLTCTMCPKMFKAEKNLREHMKTHETHVQIDPGQEVTFGCDLCPDRFATLALLDVHKRIHDLTYVKNIFHVCKSLKLRTFF